MDQLAIGFIRPTVQLYAGFMVVVLVVNVALVDNVTVSETDVAVLEADVAVSEIDVAVVSSVTEMSETDVAVVTSVMEVSETDVAVVSSVTEVVRVLVVHPNCWLAQHQALLSSLQLSASSPLQSNTNPFAPGGLLQPQIMLLLLTSIAARLSEQVALAFTGQSFDVEPGRVL
jgi:hypothetical protein